MVPEILAEIQDYTRQVKEGTVNCDYQECVHCGRSPGEKGFSYLCKRRRTFRVVLEALVQKVLSALTRWLCPRCRGSFTYYPPFAVPYKQYVRKEIEERSARYLEDDAATYRRVVRDGNSACGYACSDDGQIDERQLVGSTVHRWLTYLGSQTEKLRRVLELVKALAPRSTIHREPLPVPARKYRSESRRQSLHLARRLLHAGALARALGFGRVGSSDFATAGGEK